MDPDRALAKRASNGDLAAFETLVERHQPRLTTMAARLLGSHADAADAVQETLVRAWLALPRFRGDAKFSTWLTRICLNAVHDQRERRGQLADPEAPEAVDPHDGFAASELAGELQRALAALDEQFREAVVLYDLLGCSYAEIAELIGVAEGTVKSRIYRGRAELAQLLSGTSTATRGSN
jgi:RNA polymerase sigma-70 factor (ECF subfamily)